MVNRTTGKREIRRVENGGFGWGLGGGRKRSVFFFGGGHPDKSGD